MAEFLAKEIETIITKIGTKKICAVVSNNGANVVAARRLITQKFSHIMNVSSNSVLEHEIQVNNIVGEGIKCYITTRWSSYYDTIYLLLCLKVAFIRILEHDPDIISSNEVYMILNRGCGFKKGQYKKIAKYAGTLWSAFDSKESSLQQFLEQLASYKENELPFNDPFEPDCQIPQIW
ncbi:32360_t:CDS:2 [Gigaspora margarita]|uniref:32360_t:CDS:1 n=1 Tax=Gigaspora margarita TaxID=4874 RepID=A0ABN7W3T9_GIGMA|nr:32360_t:CDS:2 [Gigaspora margarita]